MSDNFFLRRTTIFYYCVFLIGVVLTALMYNVFYPLNPVSTLELDIYGFGSYIGGCFVATGLFALMDSFLKYRYGSGING